MFLAGHLPEHAACIPLALILACGGAVEPDAESPLDLESLQGRNVVMVLLDTLRPDHLELYGYERETAPFLNSLGQRSVVFDAAFSTSSWTAPAIASLLTGLYPVRHGVHYGLSVASAVRKSPVKRAVRRLAPQTRVLPALFRAHGYRTFCAANNPNIHRGLGFGQGFDEFVTDFELDATALLEVVYGWEEELRSGQPFFLYLHLNDVHMPYEAHASWSRPADLAGAEPVARYDSEIGYVDRELRGLFEHFGFLERDVVVVLSDHGEEFGDHGGSGHAFKLYDELQRTVMIWHLPLPDRALGRRAANVGLIDVLPTLSELLDLPAPPACDGRSLVDLLFDESTPGEFESRPLFAHRSGVYETKDIHSVILGNWKLIDHSQRGVELYDLDEDPREQRDLAALEPERKRTLLEVLNGWRERDQRSTAESVEIEIDQDLQRELTELGYVGDG